MNFIGWWKALQGLLPLVTNYFIRFWYKNNLKKVECYVELSNYHIPFMLTLLKIKTTY